MKSSMLGTGSANLPHLDFLFCPLDALFRAYETCPRFHSQGLFIFSGPLGPEGAYGVRTLWPMCTPCKHGGVGATMGTRNTACEVLARGHNCWWKWLVLGGLQCWSCLVPPMTCPGDGVGLQQEAFAALRH